MDTEKKKQFREYLLALEKYYMSESERVKHSKPFAADPEKRISLICGHILSEFDRITKG